MVVSLKNVTWRRKNEHILKNISWQINDGEHWCLFGLNGSGKTTLLNIINGYIWPTTGEVTVLGSRFGKVDLRELRKEIGWVSSAIQTQFPTYEQAEKIVLSGKFATIGLYDEVSDEDVTEAFDIMAKLDCKHLANRAYSVLSHGEKQRILIARALMAKPKLLILDEPCTGLDFIARENLLAVIEKLANNSQNISLIYVTHHVEEIKGCFSKSLLLKDGSVFSSGKTDMQFTSENISRFFGRNVTVTKEAERFTMSLNDEN